MRRVLVAGGGGSFGRRLVIGLLETSAFEVIVAGRVAPLPDVFGDRPRLTFLRLDVRTVTQEDLRRSGAFAVVDAAGPFQGGDQQLAKAAIAAGLHYLDLADARDFVAGFATLDAAARSAGVVALTGASSTPALSCAALDEVTQGWRQVDRVEVAIAPGNRAPRGLSVMRSILSYSGRPISVFQGGRWQARPGWGLTVRRVLPGLGVRWLSLAETPDLDIVPARFAVRDAAIFRAGLELPVLHLGLLVASLAVRLGLLRSLEMLARPFRWLADRFARFGSDRGGMTVQAEGLDADGLPVRGIWWLVAEAGDGPFVPTLAVRAVLRLLATGHTVQPGAGACVGIVSLAQIEAEFRDLRITSGRRFERPGMSLYETVLGDAFAGLPQPVRRMHRAAWTIEAAGMAEVAGADSRIARLIATVFRLPLASKGVPVRVGIVCEHASERWTRDFGGRRFTSRLSASGTPGRLVERFGPISFELDLLIDGTGVIGMPIRGWRLGPFALPRRLAPEAVAREYVDAQGRFCFDVEMRLPFNLGRLVRYEGWLMT